MEGGLTANGEEPGNLIGGDKLNEEQKIRE